MELNIFNLTKPHRSQKLMSLKENITWKIVNAENIVEKQKKIVLRGKTFSTCKSLASNSERHKKSISILCIHWSLYCQARQESVERNDF